MWAITTQGIPTMRIDEFGSCIYQDHDIFDLLYQNVLNFEHVQVETSDEVNILRELSGLNIPGYTPPDVPLQEFDQTRQRSWLIPEQYQDFDIYQYCVENCKTDEELIRCFEELVSYEKLKMIPILCVLKYIVDTLRHNNVIWGVGRGSSVSSYVLYKLGVHRIDSLKYGLDYTEFLRLGEKDENL